MPKLLKDDLHYVLSRTPKDVRQVLQEYHLVRLYLAGGFIRSMVAREPVSDIDLWGSTRDVLEMAATRIVYERRGRLYTTANAFTVLSNRTPIQCIFRWLFERAEDVATSFDFTVCQAVIWWDGKKWASYCTPEFYTDLAGKRLRYTSPVRDEDAGGSILRVIKYLRRGYGISPESLGKVIARLNRGLVGKVFKSEAEEARLLTALMREVDPLTLIDGIEVVEEDHEPTDNPE